MTDDCGLPPALLSSDWIRFLREVRTLTPGTLSQAADSDAIFVTQANATKYHLVSIADLDPYCPGWAAEPR